MTSPSISNAVVCKGPSGPSTMTPGRPLMVAKRNVKSSRHPLRVAPTRNRAARSAPSSTFSAAAALPPPSVTTRTSLASNCVSALRFARARCHHERGHELRMLRIDLARTRRLWGSAAWSYCAHVSACAGRKLPARGLTPLQCRRHFAEREIEHVVQQEGSPFQRRHPLKCQQQRYGQILCQFCAVVGRERCCVENRLWQPG